MSWWSRFKQWLGLSKPLGAREQLESWLEANPQVLATLHAEQEQLRGGRGNYRQIHAKDKFLSGLPAGAEFRLDVYEAPLDRASKATQFGYTLNFRAAEADGTKWQLTFDLNKIEDPTWIKI